MRVVIQRVTEASVTIDGNINGQIGKGFMILVGIEELDNDEDIAWLSKKIINLRVFDDTKGVMNIPIKESGGEILLISQFTLMAMTAKGNRPSYIRAARPETAIPVYNKFIASLESELGKKIATGKFGADMKVALINDGPITILIDTKHKE